MTGRNVITPHFAPISLVDANSFCILVVHACVAFELGLGLWVHLAYEWF